MKNKPLYKPKDLLPHFNEILRVLLPSPANVNYIFRHIKQTGLPGSGYKRKILDAINYLEENDFIVDVSGYKHHGNEGKKQIKQLTVLGRELADLINSINQYYMSYSERSKIIYSELNHTRRLVSIILSRPVSPVNIFTIIILRYVLIMSYAYSELGKNADIKKDILNGIIVRSISEHLLFSVNDLKGLIYTNKDHIASDDIELIANKDIMDRFIGGPIIQEFRDIVRQVSSPDLLSNIDDISSSTNLLSNLLNSIDDILLSILSISKPSTEFIDEEINEYEKLLGQQGRLWKRRIKRPMLNDEIEYRKRLVMLFEQYKNLK